MEEVRSRISSQRLHTSPLQSWRLRAGDGVPLRSIAEHVQFLGALDSLYAREYSTACLDLRYIPPYSETNPRPHTLGGLVNADG